MAKVSSLVNFKQFISESVHSTLVIAHKQPHFSMEEWKFKVLDQNFLVSLKHVIALNLVTVAFKLAGQPLNKVKNMDLSNKLGASSISVFSTIGELVIDFIENKPDVFVVFSCMETDKRIKLYKALLTRLGHKTDRKPRVYNKGDRVIFELGPVIRSSK